MMIASVGTTLTADELHKVDELAEEFEIDRGELLRAAIRFVISDEYVNYEEFQSFIDEGGAEAP